MLTAQVAPARSARNVAVLDQIRGLFSSAGAEVQAHERLGADGFTPGKKFVGAELIRIGRVPGAVENSRAISLGADAIKPVVARDEISTGIANNGDAEMADFVHDVFAEAVRIGELGAGIGNPFVDGAAEMFEKRTEQIAVNGGDGASRIDVDADGFAGCAGGERTAEEETCGAGYSRSGRLF